MLQLDKKLLLARLKYLDEIHNKPGSEPVDKRVSEKVSELIEFGDIESYMKLESVYTYLNEKIKEDESRIDSYAREIVAFIN